MRLTREATKVLGDKVWQSDSKYPASDFLEMIRGIERINPVGDICGVPIFVTVTAKELVNGLTDFGADSGIGTLTLKRVDGDLWGV